MKGKAARRTNEGYDKLTDEAVLKQWGLAPGEVELQVRRLEGWQRVSRRPLYHRQLLAAGFGTTRLDALRGRQRSHECGTLTIHATPWAKQLAGDLRTLSEHDDASWLTDWLLQPAAGAHPRGVQS